MPNNKRTDFFAPLNQIFYTGNDYRGEVGLEVEVEGQNLLKELPSYWKNPGDNSLRGESAEYVLIHPCKRNSVRRFLKYLKDRLDKHKSVINESLRTSVHVHLNMSSHTMVQCYNLIVLYLIFEDLLTNIAGPARVGNMFCLRARDAEYFIDILAKIARTRQFSTERDGIADPERLRYTAVNICAITKFNSLEFRALRGTVDPDTITEWVNLLLALKDAALSYAKPDDILADMSRLGAANFLRKIFPAFHKLFSKQDGWERTMWDAARLVQNVVYASDWVQTEEDKPKRLFAKPPPKNEGLDPLLWDGNDEPQPVPEPPEQDDDEDEPHYNEDDDDE